MTYALFPDLGFPKPIFDELLLVLTNPTGNRDDEK
jgi:hypothetical protein